MHLGSSLRVDATKILTRRELQTVLADLMAKARRSANAHLNLVLVRLACCCGLRVSEIAGLQVSDVRVETSRPHLRIRRGASKGGRPRVVPLWWDSGTLRDLAEWKTSGWIAVQGPRSRSSPRSVRTVANRDCRATRYADGSRPRAGCWGWRDLRR